MKAIFMLLPKVIGNDQHVEVIRSQDIFDVEVK